MNRASEDQIMHFLSTTPNSMKQLNVTIALNLANALNYFSFKINPSNLEFSGPFFFLVGVVSNTHI